MDGLSYPIPLCAWPVRCVLQHPAAILHSRSVATSLTLSRSQLCQCVLSQLVANPHSRSVAPNRPTFAKRQQCGLFFLTLCRDAQFFLHVLTMCFGEIKLSHSLAHKVLSAFHFTFSNNTSLTTIDHDDDGDGGDGDDGGDGGDGGGGGDDDDDDHHHHHHPLRPPSPPTWICLH